MKKEVSESTYKICRNERLMKQLNVKSLSLNIIFCLKISKKSHVDK